MDRRPNPTKKHKRHPIHPRHPHPTNPNPLHRPQQNIRNRQIQRRRSRKPPSMRPTSLLLNNSIRPRLRSKLPPPHRRRPHLQPRPHTNPPPKLPRLGRRNNPIPRREQYEKRWRYASCGCMDRQLGAERWVCRFCESYEFFVWARGTCCDAVFVGLWGCGGDGAAL